MAFVSLVVRNVGDPVYANDQALIKANFDDLDARQSTTEASISKVSMYEGTLINGASFSTLTGFDPKRVTQTFTAIGAIITIFTVGTLTGTIEFDIKKSTTLDPTGAVSIFTTKPSINMGAAANYDDSTNAVFDNVNKNFVSGNYFWFDITQVPTGGVISRIVLSFYGEV